MEKKNDVIKSENKNPAVLAMKKLQAEMSELSGAFTDDMIQEEVHDIRNIDISSDSDQ